MEMSLLFGSEEHHALVRLITALEILKYRKICDVHLPDFQDPILDEQITDAEVINKDADYLPRARDCLTNSVDGDIWHMFAVSTYSS